MVLEVFEVPYTEIKTYIGVYSAFYLFRITTFIVHSNVTFLQFDTCSEVPM